MAGTKTPTNLRTKQMTHASIPSPGANFTSHYLQRVQRFSVRPELTSLSVSNPPIQTIRNQPIMRPTATQSVSIATGGAVMEAARNIAGRMITPNQVTTAISGDVGHNVQQAMSNLRRQPVTTVRRVIGR